jgi:two-component system OmpR family sensor kinase
MAQPSGPARIWKAARLLPGRTPLRVKLISALLALVAVALTVISISGISVLKSYLLSQSDQQLNSLTGNFGQAERYMQAYLENPEVNYQPGVSVSWVPAGKPLQQVVRPEVLIGFGPRARGTAIAGPAVPASAQWLAANANQPVTVPAQSGGGRWRVIAVPTEVTVFNGSIVHGTVIVGLNVTDVYGTIGRLAGIDLIVSLIVILALAVVAIALVRGSLRPLTEIERTAEGIAAGDLTRRVPDRDPRTEVGRLGRSLNAMLSQIEFAFRARADSETAARRSEERMRQFVADASHELRTPLTAIRGFAEYYRQRGGLENGRPATREPDTTSIVNEEPRGVPAAGIPAAPRRRLQKARSPGPTWTGSCDGWSRNRPGWACSSRTCCCLPGSISSGCWSAAPSTCSRSLPTPCTTRG